MGWARHRYRGNKVWIEIDERGRPVADDRGLLRLRYRPEDERTYSVRPTEVHSLESEADAAPAIAPDPTIHVSLAVARGRQGWAGLGAVLRQGARRRVLRHAVRSDRAEVALWEAAVLALGAIRRTDVPTQFHVRSAAERHLLRAEPDPAQLGPALVAACLRARGRFRQFTVAEEASGETAAMAAAVQAAREAAEEGAEGARARPDGPPGGP